MADSASLANTKTGNAATANKGMASRRPLAKHYELTQTLREMVEGMRPGDKLPTQGALMRQFQVSDTTVLRSLEDLKREGRIVRRQGSGTFVAEETQTPLIPRIVTPPERGRMVAVLSRPSRSLFFADMIQAVEENLRLYDTAPVLVVDKEIDRRVERAQAYWTRGEVVGAIHIGSAVLPNMKDLPTILVGETDRKADPGYDFRQVSLDNFASGRRVGEYLWDMGHRGVAVITVKSAGATDAAPLQGVDRLRVAGLRALWEERGGTWREQWQIAHPFLMQPEDWRAVDTMRSYLEPILQSPDAPTAFFAAHDEMALVAIRALEDMGKQVPRDVSVIGFNDSGTLAAFSRPSLTTVRTPSASFGTLAVHLLQELLRHPGEPPRSIRLPPELVCRESTGPPPRAR